MSNRPGTRITKDQYDKLVEAYWNTRAPDGSLIHGAIAKAAAIAETTTSTAKAMWEKGAPRKAWPAIKDVIAQKQIALNALLEEKARKEAEQEAELTKLARMAQLKTHAEEAGLTALARQQLLPLLQTIGSLTKQTQRFGGGQGGLAEQMAELEVAKLQKWLVYEQAQVAGIANVPKPQFDRPAMSLDDVDRHLLSIARLAERTNNAARQSLELTRLFLGQPTDILEVRGEDLSQLTQDELLQRLKSAQHAISAAVTSSEPAPGNDEDEPSQDGKPALRAVAGGKR